MTVTHFESNYTGALQQQVFNNKFLFALGPLRA